MLSYFLITWVVAFFVFCIPLFFNTTKEKETIKKLYNESYKTNSEGFIETIKPLSEEYYKLSRKVDGIKYSVVLLTGFLNLIFLIMLPYIIDTDFNFPFYYSTYKICLFIIIFLYILLNLLYPPKSEGHPFVIQGGGNKLIAFLISFPFLPGILLNNLISPD